MNDEKTQTDNRWVSLGDNVLVRVADISAIAVTDNLLRIRMHGAERFDEYTHYDAARALAQFDFLREQVLGFPPRDATTSEDT